jgi:hypothetical protein
MTIAMMGDSGVPDTKTVADATPEELAKLSIPERDARMLMEGLHDQAVPVIEEELVVGKRRVDRAASVSSATQWKGRLRTNRGIARGACKG